MVLFKILDSTNGDLDITPYIVAGEYNVSSQAEYDEWRDGYHTERRGIKGWKLIGEFSMRFFNHTKYNEILQKIESSIQNGGYVNARVYDNKTRKTFDVNVFLDYDLPNLYPLVGLEDNDDITISVTQNNLMTREALLATTSQSDSETIVQV